MSETKLEVKIVGHSENFAMFAKFSLCLITKIFEFFSIFFKSNKISNKNKIIY